MFVILVYDFEEKRVAKALKICRKYLPWVQNSVFEGEISEGNLKKLRLELKSTMDIDSDSVLIYTFHSTKFSSKEVLGKERNQPSVFF